MAELAVSPRTAPAAEPLIFFDGVCGLCNRFVDFTVARGGLDRFHYAPLQGETAETYGLAGDLDSMALAKGGQLYRGSEAVLRTLVLLGGGWRVLGQLGLLVPRVLRDPLYQSIAHRRYGWFGELDACRLPSPDERARFLP